MVDSGTSSKAISSSGIPYPLWSWTLVTSLILLGVWGFPHVWYSELDKDEARYWYAAKQEVPGYQFLDHPIGQSMERRLVADETFNGIFTDSQNHSVLAFMAKRHSESVNEIGLFVHTPDRCWTEGGWNIVPVQPDLVELEFQGQILSFERRLFTHEDHFELVYFLGLVGGQTLPYRLDHNLSVAMKYQFQASKDNRATGTTQRLVDLQLWGRVLDAFRSRRPLLGPKQFVRVSTKVNPDQLELGDQRLQQFLQRWLVRIDYQQELDLWQKQQDDLKS